MSVSSIAADTHASKGAATSVFVDPRPGRQIVRLGTSVISRNGAAQFLDLSQLVAITPGSRCAPADRPVHTPRGTDSTLHVLVRGAGIKVYAGGLGDITCRAANSTVAPELVVIASSSVHVRTPFGGLRVGKRVPASVIDRNLSRPTVGFRQEVWFLSDTCVPTTITPDSLMRVTYARPITGPGPPPPITKIEIRTGALETGECNP